MSIQANTCHILMEYLREPDDLKTASLYPLGLAPGQLEVNVSEVAIAHFRNICKEWKNLSPEERAFSVESFTKRYPKVFELIKKQMVQEELQESLLRSQQQASFYLSTLDTLKQNIVGQNQAIEQLAAFLTFQKNLTEGSQSAFSNKSFLFVGPTGVGKTELAKAVSKTKNDRFIIFPMNQFQGQMDFSKFFGSGTGYLGSDDKCFFAKEMDNLQPVKVHSEIENIYEIQDAVVLFDEFEKAHAIIKQSLLTIFDEGYCTFTYTVRNVGVFGPSNNVTIKYVFKNCIFINTSNLYQNEILELFLKGAKPDEISSEFKKLNARKPTETSYSPELLSRLKLIPFGPIPKGECFCRLIKIKLDQFLEGLKTEISCKDIKIEEESLLLSTLERKLYGDGTDIRKVKSYFDDVRELIYRKKQHWGSLENKILILTCSENKPCIKISTFLEIFNCYCDTNVPTVAFPGFDETRPCRQQENISLSTPEVISLKKISCIVLSISIQFGKIFCKITFILVCKTIQYFRDFL